MVGRRPRDGQQHEPPGARFERRLDGDLDRAEVREDELVG
jgi:hypothetical protein